MKTVKLSDVVSFPRIPEAGDICVSRTGKKVVIASQIDAVKYAQYKGSASYLFIHPTAISADLLMALLPGMLAFVPYGGITVKMFSQKDFKELIIPDLTAEAEFKNSLLADKAKIDEAGAALAAAQVNYDKAVESFVAYVKANLVEINK